MVVVIRHEVVIRQEGGTWLGVCRGCGAQSDPSTYKPAVEVWRKQHYAEVDR